MLVSYVREDDNVPIATIVCTGLDEKTSVPKIGYAICHSKDKFSKEIGRKIAAGRAEKYGTIVAYKIRYKAFYYSVKRGTKDGIKFYKFNELDKEIIKMIDRAHRYYNKAGTKEKVS